MACSQSAPRDRHCAWLDLVSGKIESKPNPINTKMKALSIRFITILVGIILLSVSCKKDDPAPAATLQTKIQGNWAIATSEGTEWQEGVGIITPRAPEPSLVGSKLMIEDNMFTVKDISGTTLLGPIAFTLDETESEITIPGLGTFDIEDLVVNTSMNWEQHEPKSPSDYEPQAGCGCNLFFQKFWSLAKMP